MSTSSTSTSSFSFSSSVSWMGSVGDDEGYESVGDIGESGVDGLGRSAVAVAVAAAADADADTPSSCDGDEISDDGVDDDAGDVDDADDVDEGEDDGGKEEETVRGIADVSNDKSSNEYASKLLSLMPPCLA